MCMPDHVTGAKSLKAQPAVRLRSAGIVVHRVSICCLDDGDVIVFGDHVVRAIGTPGHTPGSTCYLWRDRLLTGDTLLIGGCGRTDFQLGDAGAMYDSILGRLFALPDDTLVYPGHDYKGRWVSTIGEEKRNNPRLVNVSREQFIEIMRTLDLPHPKQIEEAVSANLQGGTL